MRGSRGRRYRYADDAGVAGHTRRAQLHDKIDCGDVWLQLVICHREAQLVLPNRHVLTHRRLKPEGKGRKGEARGERSGRPVVRRWGC